MKRHRNPQARLPKPPSPDNDPTPARAPFDIAGGVDHLRQIVSRADAMACAAEHQLERLSCSFEDVNDAADDDDDGGARGMEHLAHLLGAAKESARTAVYVSGQLAIQLAKHRRSA